MNFEIVIINNMYMYNYMGFKNKKLFWFLYDEFMVLFFLSYNVVVSCGKDNNYYFLDEENFWVFYGG